MARITLTNKSQVTTNQVDLKASDSENIIMSRSLYQRLGSLNNNKTILSDYNNDIIPREFKDTLDKFNDYYENSMYSANNTIDQSIVKLDKFLGDLGITEEYNYSKDKVNIPLWIDPMSVHPYRYLSTPDGSVISFGNDILFRIQ